MAPKPYLSITLITFMLIMASTATARPVAKREDSPSTTAESLVHRLKLDEETGYCWDSLIELQHCTGELIMFFLNGETYIGPGCCRAIRTVGQKCWPNMMGVLGQQSINHSIFYLSY
ncbi:PREDICTED: egg cell-secreted protein 1.1-like [Tarenaya hassleriana]|uniref:egg cell-secreted protein 1.1-like n=1 Tax=Tarenaya hassleriana TaxID=28532 RepID=UPI0008FD7553|nr:PREDICTED: egg cell-secreted protein 1.1-like [Tarenaya hassleriana]